MKKKSIEYYYEKVLWTKKKNYIKLLWKKSIEIL